MAMMPFFSTPILGARFLLLGFCPIWGADFQFGARQLFLTLSSILGAAICGREDFVFDDPG